MDHVLKSITSTPIESIKVPFIPDVPDAKFVYDGKGFWGFPERVSFPVAELWKSGQRPGISEQAKAAFLQNWLYFAFVHEVTARIVDDSPTPLELADMVRKNDQAPYLDVDTTLIPSAMAAWMAVDMHATTEVAFDRTNKIMCVVVEVQNILRAVLSADDEGDISYLRAPYKNMASKGEYDTPGYRIVMSICLLGEQITNALQVIYWNPFSGEKFGAWMISNRLMRFYGLHTGLCHEEMTWLSRVGTAAHTILAYASLARQCGPRLPHIACTEESCSATPKASGPPPHVEPGCRCSLTRLSHERQIQLSRLVEAGTIPMLTVQDVSTEDQTAVELHVDGFTGNGEDTACIAISHVWSDMLGNPLENAMPACQLLKLQRTVNSMTEQYKSGWSPGKAAVKIGFWIDTICVPHDAEVKKLALAQMYSIYKDSNAVLVLDKRIEATSMSNTWHFCLWQIYASVWGRRLWTLQEGVLNANMYFAFDGDFWDIETLFLLLQKEPQGLNEIYIKYKAILPQHPCWAEKLANRVNPHREEHFAPQLLDPVYRVMREALGDLRDLRSLGNANSSVPKEQNRRGQRLLNQMALRKTTVASDESVCLAILLQMDMGELYHTPADLRLAAVVKKLPLFPSSILFTIGPRLQAPGCGWIPATFLNTGPTQTFNGENDAVPTDEGLCVELGYLSPKPQSTIKFWAGMPTNKVKTILTTADGTEYHANSHGHMGDKEDLVQEFFLGGALLLENWRASSTNALLVKVDREEGGVKYVTARAAFHVKKKAKVSGMEERGFFYGEVKKGDEGKPMLSDFFKWDASISGEAEMHAPTKFCVG